MRTITRKFDQKRERDNETCRLWAEMSKVTKQKIKMTNEKKTKKWRHSSFWDAIVVKRNMARQDTIEQIQTRKHPKNITK